MYKNLRLPTQLMVHCSFSCPVVISQKLEQFGLVLWVSGCAGWARTGFGLWARGLDPNPSLRTKCFKTRQRPEGGAFTTASRPLIVEDARAHDRSEVVCWPPMNEALFGLSLTLSAASQTKMPNKALGRVVTLRKKLQSQYS